MNRPALHTAHKASPEQKSGKQRKAYGRVRPTSAATAVPSPLRHSSLRPSPLMRSYGPAQISIEPSKTPCQTRMQHHGQRISSFVLTCALSLKPSRSCLCQCCPIGAFTQFCRKTSTRRTRCCPPIKSRYRLYFLPSVAFAFALTLALAYLLENPRSTPASR